MLNPPNKQKRQLYLTVGMFFILVSIGLLIYAFYLQWANSIMS